MKNAVTESLGDYIKFADWVKDRIDIGDFQEGVNSARELLAELSIDIFPPINTVDEAIAAVLDEGFISMKGAKLLANELVDTRQLLAELNKVCAKVLEIKQKKGN